MTPRPGKHAADPSPADRPALWWIVGGVVTIVTIAVALEGLHAGWRIGGSRAAAAYALAVGLGVTAVVAYAVVGAYSLRRRTMQERWPGSMRAWLHAHVAIGAAVGVAVVMHVGGVPVVWSDWTSGKVALLGMTVLIGSGVIWRIVYGTVPPNVARTVGNLSSEHLAREIEQLRTTIEMLVAGRGGPFVAKAQGIVAGHPIRGTGQTARLDLNDAAALVQIGLLGQQLVALEARGQRQAQFRRLLQGWRMAHVPFALVTVIAIGWHVVHVTRLTAGEPSPELKRVADFPASAECGRCHIAIHDQWLGAAHGRTQLKPVVIAQTNMFVAELKRRGASAAVADDVLADPALVCNNCHAPVAAQIKGRAELPIDPDFGRFDRRHPVLDDGITCVACHAPHAPPREALGVADDFFGALVTAESLDLADLGYGGRMYAGEPRDAVAVPYHDAGRGFMTGPAETSQLCGACHSVHLDLDGSPPDATPDADRDLVLQETFREWKDQHDVRGGPGCTSCHMAPQTGRVADVAPLLRPSPPRAYAGHTFHVPIEGAAALAVDVAVDSDADGAPRLVADVTVTNVQGGHNFPTGFRFAREFWLEVSAETDGGEPVCLAPEPVTGAPSPCASGRVAAPDEDLAACDVAEAVQALAAAGRPATLKGTPYPDVRHEPGAARPLFDCDPWLTTFRPHLTDGDPDKDKVFDEVPFQSIRPGLVKDPLRVADGTSVSVVPPGEGATFRYDFDVAALGGESVIVQATLRYRRFPPHFLRALGAPIDYFPSGSSAESELAQLTITVVDDAESDAITVPR